MSCLLGHTLQITSLCAKFILGSKTCPYWAPRGGKQERTQLPMGYWYKNQHLTGVLSGLPFGVLAQAQNHFYLLMTDCDIVFQFHWSRLPARFVLPRFLSKWQKEGQMDVAQCDFCEDLTLCRYGACWNLNTSYSWVYNHVLMLQINHGKLPLV